MRSNLRYKLGWMIVANCIASCYWLHEHCSQWKLLLFFHPDSRLYLSQHGRSCREFQHCFTRCTNSQLVAKCEQILCRTSCEFDKQAAKPKFVAQSRPTLYYSQRVYRERWKTRNISWVESFCIEYIVAAFKAAIYEISVFVSRISLALEQPNIFIFL